MSGHATRLSNVTQPQLPPADTSAPKTSVLEDLIATDLASGQAVFLIPPDRKELAAVLWRALDGGTPPHWLPEDTSVVFWGAGGQPGIGGERNTSYRGGLGEDDRRGEGSA